MAAASRLLSAGVAFASAALSLSACGAPPSKCGPSTGVVSNVVDGDTVDLESGVRLRLLLVNTQEITKGKNECYGQQAADFTREQLLGKNVQLAYDEAGCTDRYGRTLAYVTVEGQELNAQLVENGYACVLHIPPAGDSRADEFMGMQAGAKSAGKGMWGSCDAGTCY